MAGDIKGITIEFRGDTTKLDKALRDIDNETKAIDDELRKVNTALKFNPQSVELWRQKQQLLKDKIVETKDKLDVLKQAQKQMDTDKVDKNSKQYRELRREIIETESKLKTFKAQLREIGNVKLKALSEEFKKVGDKLTSAGEKLTKVTAVITAAYTAATKMGSDYAENLNKIDVAFGHAANTVKDWAETTRNLFGLSKVQATESVAAFGALAKGIGFTEDEAAKVSTTLTGLAADLGSYFNVDMLDAAGALEGIFTGNTVALKRFGVVLTETNLKQFAKDIGVTYDKLSQQEKTMLRYQYVLKATEDAQGDFARTSDQMANASKVFKASLQDLATTVGTVLLPIITPIIQKLTEWINKFNELDPKAQKIIVYIGLFVAALGPLLIILGTVAKAIGAVTAVIAVLSGPVGVAIAIIGALSAAIALLVAAGKNMVSSWKTLKAEAQRVWTGIKNDVTNAVEAVKNAITKVKNLLSGSLSFPKIKLPHFNITGSFSLSPPSVPKIGVQWYAKGGIFTQPTILSGVGEAGAEAVLPIDKLQEMVNFGNAEGNALLAQMVSLLANMETSLTTAMKEALKGVKVELDDDEVGQFVEDTVAKAIYV